MTVFPTYDSARPELSQKRRDGDDADPIHLKTFDHILIEQVTVERNDALGLATTRRLYKHVIVRIAATLGTPFAQWYPGQIP